LGRLLRLAMFQLVIGMITALLVGTLNRVMIVELHVPAWWVALAVAIPMVFAPLRTLIGYRSDTHPSALGLRRIPYLWSGSLLLFGGLAIMPFALLLLAEAVPDTLWLGRVACKLHKRQAWPWPMMLPPKTSVPEWWPCFIACC
jgi:BCD family chlorophyll transporter-like MFS transporter